MQFTPSKIGVQRRKTVTIKKDSRSYYVAFTSTPINWFSNCVTILAGKARQTQQVKESENQFAWLVTYLTDKD
jgi:hypothetical protein